MSLRNELRNPQPAGPVNETYSWEYWYPNMVWAANCINYFNPGPLIFFSGLGYDSGVAQITEAQDLGGGHVFNLTDFPYSNKVVFEIHNYANGYNGTCPSFNEGLYTSGYDAMDTSANSTGKNIAPVVMSEFGFQQDNVTYTYGYARCIKEYLSEIKGGWMQWVLAGSYYIKLGVQDSHEGWGECFSLLPRENAVVVTLSANINHRSARLALGRVEIGRCRLQLHDSVCKGRVELSEKAVIIFRACPPQTS